MKKKYLHSLFQNWYNRNFSFRFRSKFNYCFNKLWYLRRKSIYMNNKYGHIYDMGTFIGCLFFNFGFGFGWNWYVAECFGKKFRSNSNDNKSGEIEKYYALSICRFFIWYDYHPIKLCDFLTERTIKYPCSQWR